MTNRVQKQKAKQIIEITYWSRQQPSVKVPEGLNIEVKLIDGQAEDSLILTHNGISIYSTVKDDMGDSFMHSEYWVSTSVGLDWEDGDAFDLRDLPNIPEADEPTYEKLFPDDSDKQALAYAIDSGWIDRDGFHPEGIEGAVNSDASADS